MFAPFNYIHWIFIATIPVAIVLFYFIFRKAGKKAQTIFLLTILGIAAASEIYDMFRLVPQLGWKHALTELPLYLTDIDIAIVIIAVVWNYKGRKTYALDMYLLFPVLMAGVASIVFVETPPNVYPWYSYEVLSNTYTHYTLFISAILYFLFNGKGRKGKPFYGDKCWPGFFLMEGLTIFDHIINLILVYTGLNPSANYNFTMYGPSIDAFKVASSFLGRDVKYVHCLPIMLLTWFAIYMFCWSTWKIVEIAIKRHRIKKASKEKAQEPEQEQKSV